MSNKDIVYIKVYANKKTKDAEYDFEGYYLEILSLLNFAIENIADNAGVTKKEILSTLAKV